MIVRTAFSADSKRCAEIRLNLIADQPRGAAGPQPSAGFLQNLAQEIDDFLGAEHGVQSSAIGNAVGRHVADRVEYEIRAAKLQKSAMSHLIVRGPSQKIDRGVLSDEGLQRLAALVPVDQKDDARAQKR